MEKDAEFYRKFLRAIEHGQSKLIKKRRNDPSEVKLQRKAALRSAFARIWRFQFPLPPILIANGQEVSQFITKVDRGYAAERGFPRAHGFKSDPYKYANRQQGTYGFVGGSSVQPHTQTHWQSVPSTKGAGPLGLRGDGGDAEDPDSFGLLDSRERLDTSDSHLKDGNDAAFGGTAEIAPEGGKKRGKLPRKRPNYKNEVEAQVTDKTTRPEETMMDKCESSQATADADAVAQEKWEELCANCGKCMPEEPLGTNGKSFSDYGCGGCIQRALQISLQPKNVYAKAETAIQELTDRISHEPVWSLTDGITMAAAYSHFNKIQEFVKAGALRLLSGVIVSSEDLEILRQCLLGLQTLLRHDADGTWGKEFRQLGGLDKVQRILEMPKIPRPEPETDFLFNWGPVLIEEDCIEFANDILTMFQTTSDST